MQLLLPGGNLTGLGDLNYNFSCGILGIKKAYFRTTLKFLEKHKRRYWNISNLLIDFNKRFSYENCFQCYIFTFHSSETCSNIKYTVINEKEQYTERIEELRVAPKNCNAWMGHNGFSNKPIGLNDCVQLKIDDEKSNGNNGTMNLFINGKLLANGSYAIHFDKLKQFRFFPIFSFVSWKENGDKLRAKINVDCNQRVMQYI